MLLEQRALDVHCVRRLADDGAGVRAEISGCAALGENARRQHFQPSEWVKLILILAVAKYFADLQTARLSWPDFIKAGAIVGVPMLMVLAQPDLRHRADLSADRDYGLISRRNPLEAGARLSFCWRAC